MGPRGPSPWGPLACGPEGGGGWAGPDVLWERTIRELREELEAERLRAEAHRGEIFELKQLMRALVVCCATVSRGFEQNSIDLNAMD